jgi:hypothetical protein
VSYLQRTYRSLSMTVLKLNVMTFSCMFQLFTWLLMLKSVPMHYSWKILRLSQTTWSYDLPKVKCKFDEESSSMMPLNVTSDLESHVIGGLFGCDLDQINARPNKNASFLELVVGCMDYKWMKL